MSLQGSLESFALPDVLVLLSSTKKDGELRVVGGKVDGRVWLEKGQIVHSAVGGTETTAVDGLFQLLRLESGTFNFDADSKPDHRSEPETIDLALADAQVRLGEWNEIARVVPHLDAIVDMAADAPDDEVMVTREHWRLLRSVAGGRSVLDLMTALGQSEFDACRTVKELVDLKLASIDIDAKPKAKAAAPAAPAAKAARDSAPEPEPEPVSAKSEAPAAEAVKAAAEKPKASAPSEDASKSDAQAEIDKLVEMASRPSKVRASTSTETDGNGSNGRPAATKSNPVLEPAEEARALVAQLAALSGEEEAAVAAKVTEHLASGGELPDVIDGDEPINRGLLLKFLSSVRN